MCEREENTMTITNEQRNILTFIMDNKNVLEELYAAIPKETKVSDLKLGESVKFADLTWSKFAEDNEGNAYMLADESICDMEFGENNDWRESSIRNDKLNELYKKIVTGLGADALVTIQTDLFSHDGLRDYGKCEDMVSLLTYDLYRNNRENIKDLDECWWLSTPDSTPFGCGASFVLCVGSDGGVIYDVCNWSDCGVRPFCILKSSIFVSCED